MPTVTKTPVDFLGKFETVIETKGRYTVGVFYVVNEYDSGCLLSWQTAQELSLISLHLNKIKSAPNVVNKTIKDAKLSKLPSKHNNGLGKLKDHKVKQEPWRLPSRQAEFNVGTDGLGLDAHSDYHAVTGNQAYFELKLN